MVFWFDNISILDIKICKKLLFEFNLCSSKLKFSLKDIGDVILFVVSLTAVNNWLPFRLWLLFIMLFSWENSLDEYVSDEPDVVSNEDFGTL